MDDTTWRMVEYLNYTTSEQSMSQTSNNSQTEDSFVEESDKSKDYVAYSSADISGTPECSGSFNWDVKNKKWVIF